ncbi:MAG: neutral/alkaline non-lysosomal ceramidase N-terminal domain-containing protein, partial [Caldilineaceae bacterium]|nr:neutral/alkaline non-lysosomal ceramidase N-terminal domain-containing protein [Caldilineaceae bacterium]
MTNLLAGFGRADITPHLGFPLVGYGNRASGATGIHDRLSAKALVLETEEGFWVLASVEMCYLGINTVRDLRQLIEQRLGIPPAHVLVATTHTHSGPRDRDSGNWDRPLIE